MRPTVPSVFIALSRADGDRARVIQKSLLFWYFSEQYTYVVRDFRLPEGIFRPRKSYAHRQSRKGTPTSELGPGWIRGRAAWISLRCHIWRPWIVLRTAARGVCYCGEHDGLGVGT